MHYPLTPATPTPYPSSSQSPKLTFSYLHTPELAFPHHHIEITHCPPYLNRCYDCIPPTWSGGTAALHPAPAVDGRGCSPGVQAGERVYRVSQELSLELQAAQGRFGPPLP